MMMVGKIYHSLIDFGMRLEWRHDAIANYLCADKKLRLRSENARREEESVSERRRETSMFECGVDLFAVVRLAGGCWDSCI